jgi:hypothetical protein
MSHTLPEILKQLTPEQTKVVLDVDPLIHDKRREVIYLALADADVPEEVMYELILFWANRMVQKTQYAQAFLFLADYDKKNGTTRAIHLASSVGSIGHWLFKAGDSVKWTHFVSAGNDSFLSDRLPEALEHYKAALRLVDTSKGYKVIRSHLRRLKARAIERLDLVSVRQSNCYLGKPNKLTRGDELVLRKAAIQRLFDDDADFLDGKAVDFLVEFGSKSEKRFCLNLAVRKRGLRYFEELASRCEIEPTEKHLRTLYGSLRARNETNSKLGSIVLVLEMLCEFDKRFERALSNAYLAQRYKLVSNRYMRGAHELAEQIGVPLTFEELYWFLQYTYQKSPIEFNTEQVPFVEGLIAEILYGDKKVEGDKMVLQAAIIVPAG